MNRLLKLDIDDMRSNLFVILLAGFGAIRAIEWIVKDVGQLANYSDLYLKMSVYMDIHTIGWFLFLFSIVLFLSIFFESIVSHYLVILGSFVCGSIHLVFGMISVDSADFFTTYYTNMLVGVIQYLLLLTGVIGLWKHKNSQNID